MNYERVTDSAGQVAVMVPIEDVWEGAAILEGWRPLLIVESVESQSAAMLVTGERRLSGLSARDEAYRLNFVGGHKGGWHPAGSTVPVEVPLIGARVEHVGHDTHPPYGSAGVVTDHFDVLEGAFIAVSWDVGGSGIYDPWMLRPAEENR